MLDQYDHVVHLAIDVQPVFYNKLDAQRAIAFPQMERAFCDRLKQELGISTIHVGYWDYFRIYNDKILRSYPPSFGHQFGLNVQAGESIVLKNNDSAFRDSDLARYLRNKNITQLIITGMHSGLCVTQNAAHAVTNQFDCLVVHDHLANATKNNDDRGGDPEWHKAIVQCTAPQLCKYPDRINFGLSQNLFSDPARYLWSDFSQAIQPARPTQRPRRHNNSMKWAYD